MSPEQAGGENEIMSLCYHDWRTPELKEFSALQDLFYNTKMSLLQS